MERALVIGGSGMLAETCHWLEKQGYEVYVVGRTRSKMAKLLENSQNILPLYTDYRDVNDFKQKINQTFDWSLVVAWIHNVPENPMKVLLDVLFKQKSTCDFYHVLGSSSNLNTIKEKLKTPKNCTYHQVQLGFILETGYSRWLTNQEISKGVIEAFKLKQPTYIVGQLEPWDQRP